MKGKAAKLIIISWFFIFFATFVSFLMSALTILRFLFFGKYCFFPEEKLSKTVTVAFWDNNWRTTSDPIKPAPPVTNTRFSLKSIIDKKENQSLLFLFEKDYYLFPLLQGF